MRPLPERLRQVVERGDDIGSRNVAMMAEAADELDSLALRLSSCEKDLEARDVQLAATMGRVLSAEGRLSSALMHARSLYDCCPGELDVMVLRLIETLEPPSKCDHDWQPDEGQWQKCSRCGAIQHPAVDLLDQRKRLVEKPVSNSGESK